ncbi:hypothetical protein F4604DRAFT_1912721 [Suillus subluteus]|nr:hypothetical protein F4604DRAFT_1912721 [Suillus subluteus]
MSAGHITNRNLFLVGDIFLTILRSGHNLSIGVLRSTSASLNGVSHASLNITIMTSLRSNAKITGQLLSLVPTDTSLDAAQMFLWDGGYVTARSVIQGTSDSTAHVIVVTVLGPLMEPVNPEPTFLRLCEDINSNAFSQVNGGQGTWQIPRDAMQAACDLIWAKTTQMKLSLRSIVSVTPLDAKSFPYKFSDGTVAVFSAEANSLLAASEGERIATCPLCEARVPDMRCHVGQHILCALCNMPEVVDMKEQVGETYVCGFCGHSDRPECAITITVTASSAPIWETKCTYQHVFKYRAADNGSKNKPCRNIPLKSEGVELPACIWDVMMLTDLEQSTAHIPKEYWITPPNVSSGSDKENVPTSSSCPLKCSVTASTSYKPAKRSRTAHTLLQQPTALLA